ncbi:MAG: hypothetical protein LBF26_03775 [Puniceicoccales bacterium]|jgi:hypothetical protein|nr:hypothetical protein [Puniceicoccales bacterium]
MSSLSINKAVPHNSGDGTGVERISQEGVQTKPGVTQVSLSFRERYQQWQQELEHKGVDCPSRDDILEFLNSGVPVVGPDGKLCHRGDEGLSAEEKEAHVRIDVLAAIHREHADEIEARMIELRRAGHSYVEILDELRQSYGARVAEKPEDAVPDQDAVQTVEVIPPVRAAEVAPPARPGFWRGTRGQMATLGAAAVASIGGMAILGPFGIFVGFAFLPLSVFLFQRERDG